jgi:hypothetical protein
VSAIWAVNALDRLATLPGVKTIATGRMGEVVAKYGENAPMATVCCNACRTCVTTNIVAILGTALTVAGGGVWRVVRRKSA